jgi:hypothetical protein
MKIELKLEPFHHIIIDDFYTDEEHNYVLEELFKYKSMDLFGPPMFGGSATDNFGNQLKDNTSFFLDQYPELGDTCINLKLFNRFIRNLHIEEKQSPNISNRSWFFNSELPESSSSLFSYYENGQKYEPHNDRAIYTWLTWINKEPKRFSGGNLYFPNFNYTIEYRNNRTVCFFSRLRHSVTPVVMESEFVDKDNGRFTITRFMNVF